MDGVGLFGGMVVVGFGLIEVGFNFCLGGVIILGLCCGVVGVIVFVMVCCVIGFGGEVLVFCIVGFGVILFCVFCGVDVIGVRLIMIVGRLLFCFGVGWI